MDSVPIAAIREAFRRSHTPFNLTAVRSAIEITQVTFRQHGSLPRLDLYADSGGPPSLETILLDKGIGEHIARPVINGLIGAACLEEDEELRAPLPSPKPGTPGESSCPMKAILCATEKLGEIDLGHVLQHKVTEEIGLSVNLRANTVAVSQEAYDIEPHHAQMLNSLVEAAKAGEWWVTGPVMQDLPACGGKKIDREMKAIKERAPPLENLIISGGPKGYRLKKL